LVAMTISSLKKRRINQQDTSTDNTERHKPVTTLLHPLANPHLGLVVLVVVGTIPSLVPIIHTIPPKLLLIMLTYQ
jgi:sorbitol-specific phosphotransferase system component IIBC